ncbi:MAG: DUF2752 domain-containing protein [Muribaculaceae bacterium]|nr:DUF2752 domain-containing protein [Muribaculaceae bacterium]
MPRCMLHDITGYQCPGCGMQRAIYHALHGNLHEAWRMNYALPGIILIVGIYASAEAIRTRNERIYLALHHPIALAILFALTLGWWIGRNILGI